ncbi:MAG: ATP-dependent DNA ligase [Thermoplasmata archaeon]|nr:ATP-dependent DNA ligase [Thermoplasmata archaeon]
MEYLKLAEAFEKIEAISKRLEMTEILVELFNEAKILDPKLFDKVVYLTQGKLFEIKPEESEDESEYKEYIGAIEIGIAEKLALKAIYEATRVDESKIKNWWIESGDLGSVAFQAVSMKKQTSLFTEKLDIHKVFINLLQLSVTTGPGSQDQKMKILAKLFHDSSPIEAKYIARTLNGKMRLGLADMTIIDALAQTFGKKEDREKVEWAYNTCSNLGKVANVLRRNGIEGLNSIKVTPRTPLKAMLCERLPSIPDIIEKLDGKCAFEYKYDGLRIQAHIFPQGFQNEPEVYLFTRQLENVTSQFPDIVEMLKPTFSGIDCIIEGECVPVDINTGEMLPFQVVSRRRGRKHELGSAVDEFPVMLFLFDCLYLDGQDYTQTPYTNRRKMLESCISESERVKLADVLITDDSEKADEYFQNVIGKGGEGIIAKSLADDSFYRAGSRGWNWIKFKRDYKTEMADTVDLVIVGAFSGKGKRAGNYGALLMATYNADEGVFETVTKLGSGFDDEMLAALPELLDEHKIDKPHKLVNSKMKADYWFEPAIVLEVRGAEITLSPIHTCAINLAKENYGLAIRFPRYMGILRQDKGPEDATTTDEMLALYDIQSNRGGE